MLSENALELLIITNYTVKTSPQKHKNKNYIDFVYIVFALRGIGGNHFLQEKNKKLYTAFASSFALL